MKDVKVNDTHCFALIGHTADGKTSCGLWIGPVLFKNQPEAFQGQEGLDSIDRSAFGGYPARESAGGDHAGVGPEFAANSLDH